MATQGTGSPGLLAPRIEALKAGTAKNIAGKTTVVVTGLAMSAMQIIARLGHVETLAADILRARAEVKRAMAAYDEAVPGLLMFIANYEASLRGLFGVDHPKLRDFGITPAKSRTPAAEAKNAAGAKAGKQTGAARATAATPLKPAAPGAVVAGLVKRAVR
jgi:hypothetical protein